MFIKLTKYVKHILIECIITWVKYMYNSFQFTQESWDKLMQNECEDNYEESIDDPKWIQNNFEKTNIFLTHEIKALNELLNDQIINECVNIMQSLSIQIPSHIQYLFGDKHAVSVQNGTMKAILCDTMIYFYGNDNDTIENKPMFSK